MDKPVDEAKGDDEPEAPTVWAIEKVDMAAMVREAVAQEHRERRHRKDLGSRHGEDDPRAGDRYPCGAEMAHSSHALMQGASFVRQPRRASHAC